jgi:hypothetical protein
LGGILLWAGTVSLGVSTVVLLAVLSRHLRREDFSGLSTLFGLFFVASLIPSGIPFRAAALIADGAEPLKVTTRNYVLSALAGAAIAPLIGLTLHVPVLAVDFIAAQVIIAIPLSIRRGDQIARQRFAVLGGNFFLEAGMRILLGTLFGLLWGITGLSLGIALATLVAMAALPSRPTSLSATPRPTTSLINTWLTLVLLGVFVQLDILLAPSGMSKMATTSYDLAAVPSKGVYILLLAASTFVFPYIRLHARRRTIILAGSATVLVGFAVTAALLPLRGLMAQVLGQNTAPFLPLLALGAAMSIAGATGVILNGDIALGAVRPWPSLLVGIGGIFACWATRPTVNQFALGVLAAQATTMAICLFVCLRHWRNGVRVAPTHRRTVPAHRRTRRGLV